MTPRNAPLAAASLCLCASFLVTSCGPPAVSALGDIQEEDGIAQLTYSSDALSSFVLAEGQAAEAFQLRDLAPATAFTRVGVRWDADTRGGMTSVQVRAVQSAGGGDQWMTVIVDSQELVPETGITLYAGHVDMPAGAQLETRFHLVRTDPSLPSPVLRAISIEAFDAATIAEAGEAGAGDGMESASGSVEGPVSEAPSPAAFVPAVTIVSRAAWGASAARCEGNTHTPYRMTFHETVTPNGERGAAARARMRQMQSYHQASRGYCDIGYHFAVDADGVVYQGRSTSGRAAAHTKNQNTGNIGVALMGTYDSVSAPESQLEGLMDIFAMMADTYDITVNADRVRGHQQWPGQSTSCPGAKVLARKPDILDGTVARMMGGTGGGGGGGTSRPEIVVDNTSTDFLASPDWFLSTAIADPYGEDYRARSTALVSDPAYWSATLDGGSYEVFVWYTAATNRASAAPYFVYHQDGTTTLPVNQQLNGTRWVSLGTYAFTAGKNERVGLSCWTASGDFVIADAVKFVPR